MFVRFRPTERRLQVSVIETTRHDGKVQQHHVASLGSLPQRPLPSDRVVFWKHVDERLYELSDRIDATMRAKLRGEIEDRVPQPTANELRKKRQKRQKSTPPRRTRWQVLPPEGKGECDYDGELEAAFDDEPESETRRHNAAFQEFEAARMAREYALLRVGTEPEEITVSRLRKAKAAAAAWSRLVNRLQRTLEQTRGEKARRIRTRARRNRARKGLASTQSANNELDQNDLHPNAEADQEHEYNSSKENAALKARIAELEAALTNNTIAEIRHVSYTATLYELITAYAAVASADRLDNFLRAMKWEPGREEAHGR